MAKKGRPKGSKTTKAARTVVRPEGCNACGSTDRKVVPGSRTIERAFGMTVAGTYYSTRVIRRVRCDNCGNIYIEETLKNKGRILSPKNN